MKMLDGMLNVKVTWRGKKFIVEISSGAILKDLGLELQKLSGVKPETMRLIVPSSAHSSRLLYPFSDEHSQLGLQECFILEGKLITMMGVSGDELEEIMTNSKANLRIAGFEEEDERLKQRALGNSHAPLKLPQGPYIFCDFRTLQLPGIELNPPPSEALKRMHMLAADPGIIGIMNKHRWRVGIMTEMAPEGYVGVSPECILGFNKNHGEEISLRLRTDDLKGFRKYESIKKTLLHELAHMVFSEHDANFFALNKQLNEEAFSLDWTRSRSHTLNGVRPSMYYDEEFLVGNHSNAPQKLGGNTNEQLESARFSSVAAAQRRFANNVNTLEVSEEHIGLDQDDSESNLNRRHNPVENDTLMLSNTTLSNDSNRTAERDDCFAGVNNIEPDPDDSADDNTMESESYSGTCDVTISPKSSSSNVRMSQIGSPFSSAGMLSTAKIPSEPNPDDVNAWQKNLGDAKIVGSDPEQIEETMQQQTPEKRVIEEPDPDDSRAVGIPDDESVPPSDSDNTYEPDPDDYELKSIHDSVTVFYDRLQNSIEALRAGINPQEVMIVLQTLFKIISNVIEHPDDRKFKKLRKANPAFQRNVANFQAAMQVLFLIGFSEDVVPDEAGRIETYLVLKRNDPGLLWLAKSSLEKFITL